MEKDRFSLASIKKKKKEEKEKAEHIKKYRRSLVQVLFYLIFFDVNSLRKEKSLTDDFLVYIYIYRSVGCVFIR